MADPVPAEIEPWIIPCMACGGTGKGRGDLGECTLCGGDGIKVIDEPDVIVTSGELERYRQEYQEQFAWYSGPKPTLEEFIRRRQADTQVSAPERKDGV